MKSWVGRSILTRVEPHWRLTGGTSEKRVDRSCRPAIFDAEWCGSIDFKWIRFVVDKILQKPKPKPKSVFFLRFSVIFGFSKTDVGFGFGFWKNRIFGFGFGNRPRTILNTLGPHKAKPTLDFFYTSGFRLFPVFSRKSTNTENKRRCVITAIYRQILNTLGPHKAKPTLDFFYFRFPLVFSIFTKKYKYWKQATVRDMNDISTDSEHPRSPQSETNVRFLFTSGFRLFS